MDFCIPAELSGELDHYQAIRKILPAAMLPVLPCMQKKPTADGCWKEPNHMSQMVI